MPKPKVIFFDVNETLLDLGPLQASVGKALGGREDLPPLWFSTMLHYSLVDTITENYRPFADIGVAALMMLAEQQGIPMDREAAREAIVGPFLTLPPHGDVKPALEKLAASEIEVVALANSAAGALRAQFENGKIIQYFDRRISTEEVQAFKPDPRPYRHALEIVGAAPGEAMMVAAHAWDLAGAKKVGLETVFIRRPGVTLYPNVDRPDHVIDGLEQLTDMLGL